MSAPALSAPPMTATSGGTRCVVAWWRGAGPAPHVVVLVGLATYNFINKLALGINDTYALNVVAEAIGRGTPVAILPFLNSALAARHPFQHAVRSLRAEGVRALFGPGEWQPHPPGTGGQHLAAYPWHRALAAVTDRATPAVVDGADLST